LTSTLGEKAFQLAGEISDGAIYWLCPVSYLLNTGLPALRKASSSSSERSSEPPLVAHVLVALSQDGHLILEKGHQLLNYYTKLLFMLKCSLTQVFLLQLQMVMELLYLMLL
jgi:hypothetical protein